MLQTSRAAAPPGRRAALRLIAAIGAGAAGLSALGGCDMQRISELEVGVTTEQQIRAKWGEPAAVYGEADGGRILEYPRQPAGQVNYMLAIDADGRLRSLRQVLKAANFERIQPGWDRTQVRRLLGRPASMQRYALKQQEVWEWRWADGGEAKVFSVVFDDAGRVVSTGSTADPKEAGQRG